MRKKLLVTINQLQNLNLYESYDEKNIDLKLFD